MPGCDLQTRLRILQEANEGLTAAAASSRAGRKGPNGTPPLKGALRGALQALNGLPGALRDRGAAADARRKAAKLALPSAGASALDEQDFTGGGKRHADLHGCRLGLRELVGNLSAMREGRQWTRRV